jgi:hypothetical protein
MVALTGSPTFKIGDASISLLVVDLPAASVSGAHLGTLVTCKLCDVI